MIIFLIKQFIFATLFLFSRRFFSFSFSFSPVFSANEQLHTHNNSTHRFHQRPASHPTPSPSFLPFFFSPISEPFPLSPTPRHPWSIVGIAVVMVLLSLEWEAAYVVDYLTPKSKTKVFEKENVINFLSSEETRDTKGDPSSCLRNGIRGEFIETKGWDGNQTYQFQSYDSVPDYIGALRCYARNETQTDATDASSDSDINFLSSEETRDTKGDPSSRLRNGIRGEFIETKGRDGNRTYQFKSYDSVPDYIGALQRYARNETQTNATDASSDSDDMKLLEGLRGKRIVLMGDSTDEHVFYSLCSCPTTNVRMLIYAAAPIQDSSRKKCYGSRPYMQSCVWPSLSLSIQHLAIEYALHPYGDIPYDRVGPYGSCKGHLNLTECLYLKWNQTTNGIDGLKEMHDGVVDQPDIVSININLWYWFRLQWYHRHDPIDFLELDNESHMIEYTKNLTEFFQAFQYFLPNVPTWAMTTSIMTTETSRISSTKISVTNPAIRNFTSNSKNLDLKYPLVLVDWDVMTSDLPRKEVLHDGIHGKYFFNRAIGNVYLNALAASDSSLKRREFGGRSN